MTLPPESFSDTGPIPNITSDQIRQRLEANGVEVDDERLAGLFWLLMDYSRVTRGGGTSNAGWNVMPDVWALRPYRAINNFGDFVTVRDELQRKDEERVQRFRRAPTVDITTGLQRFFPLSSGGAAQGGSEQMVDLPAPTRPDEEFVDPRYVFILMPFSDKAEWSDRVYGWITEVMKSLVTTYPGLNWRRADEIVQHGQISDQIRSEIVRAGVIVADITESNPNVLYELGYADGKSKNPVILNQHPEASPFDLAAQRQLQYNIDNEHSFRENLREWMRVALGPVDDAAT
jgi:hypothetical protein